MGQKGASTHQASRDADIQWVLQEPSWSLRSCGVHYGRPDADELPLAQSQRASKDRNPKAEALSLPTWVWLRAGQESLLAGVKTGAEKKPDISRVKKPRVARHSGIRL